MTKHEHHGYMTLRHELHEHPMHCNLGPDRGQQLIHCKQGLGASSCKEN